MKEDEKLTDDIVLKDARQIAAENNAEKFPPATPEAGQQGTGDNVSSPSTKKDNKVQHALQFDAIANRTRLTSHAPEALEEAAETQPPAFWHTPLLLADLLLAGAGVVLLLSSIVMALFSIEHNILNALSLWLSLLNLVWLGACGLFINYWTHGGVLAHDGWIKLAVGLSVYIILGGNIASAATKPGRTAMQRMGDIAFAVIPTLLLMPIPSILSLQKSTAAGGSVEASQRQPPDIPGWLIGGGAAFVLALPVALIFPTEEAWLEGYLVYTAVIMLLSIPIALFMRRKQP